MGSFYKPIGAENAREQLRIIREHVEALESVPDAVWDATGEGGDESLDDIAERLEHFCLPLVTEYCNAAKPGADVDFVRAIASSYEKRGLCEGWTKTRTANATPDDKPAPATGAQWHEVEPMPGMRVEVSILVGFPEYEECEGVIREVGEQGCFVALDDDKAGELNGEVVGVPWEDVRIIPASRARAKAGVA